MNNILAQICKKKKIELELSKKRCSFSSLEKLIEEKNNRNFKQLLMNSQIEKRNNLIAEIKKASPSAGIIIEDYFPENIAVSFLKIKVLPSHDI